MYSTVQKSLTETNANEPAQHPKMQGGDLAASMILHKEVSKLSNITTVLITGESMEMSW